MTHYHLRILYRTRCPRPLDIIGGTSSGAMSFLTFIHLLLPPHTPHHCSTPFLPASQANLTQVLQLRNPYQRVSKEMKEFAKGRAQWVIPLSTPPANNPASQNARRSTCSCAVLQGSNRIGNRDLWGTSTWSRVASLNLEMARLVEKWISNCLRGKLVSENRASIYINV